MQTRAIVLFAALGGLVFASCEPPADGLVEPAAAVAAALDGARCMREYVNETFGLGFEVPCGFEAEVTRENPGTADHKIKQRTTFTRHGGAPIVVDVWENPTRLPLDRWVERFRRWALYIEPMVEGPGRAGREGAFPAFLQIAPATRQAPLREVTLLWTGPLVVSIQYVNMDHGASRDGYSRMVDTFDVQRGSR